VFSAGDDPDNPNVRPAYYCHLHNSAPEEYPINPELTLDPNFYWDGVIRDDSYYRNLPEEGTEEGEGEGDGLEQTDGQPEQGSGQGLGPWPNPSVNPPPANPPPASGANGETPQDANNANNNNNQRGGTPPAQEGGGEQGGEAPPPDWLNLEPAGP
jgi:hypothetical protein